MPDTDVLNRIYGISKLNLLVEVFLSPSSIILSIPEEMILLSPKTLAYPKLPLLNLILDPITELLLVPWLLAMLDPIIIDDDTPLDTILFPMTLDIVPL